VKENIYEPAGMTDTDAYELDRETPNLAVGYTRIGTDGKLHPGEWRNNIFLHVIKGGPAGGGYSTAPDLARFGQALRGGKLLKAASVETLTTEKIKSEGVPDEGYGYGFGISKIREHPIVGHGGGFPGISCSLDLFTDLGYTAVVLSNYDEGARPIVDKLRDLIAR
jgi:CubicO group peptidase (beta-lactamase class C family)